MYTLYYAYFDNAQFIHNLRRQRLGREEIFKCSVDKLSREREGSKDPKLCLRRIRMTQNIERVQLISKFLVEII